MGDGDGGWGGGGVIHLPVLGPVLLAPSDNLNRVAASHTPGDVVVDTARVVLEILKRSYRDL